MGAVQEGGRGVHSFRLERAVPLLVPPRLGFYFLPATLPEIAACAAASRATGTRNGEQDT